MRLFHDKEGSGGGSGKSAITSTSNSPISAGQTRYHGIGGNLQSTIGLADFPYPFAGTAKNLYIDLSTAPGGVDTIIATVFLNGVATGITVTITGASTTGNDLVNTFAVSAGDLLGIRYVASATCAGTRPKWGLEVTPS